MPRIIAIMNQKGGVGKTTTTLNLGAALAHRGKRVLLVDLDPQANLTLGLGHRAADLNESIYELLTNPKADTAQLIVKSKWDRLHLLPSHIDLSGAEIEMVSMIGRETRLSKALQPVYANYDYILIDCLPSLSLLTVNAMVTASEVFIPLQAHPFALEGLGKLFEVVGMIREAMNPVLTVTGVLVTMFDGRTNVSKVTLESLHRDERLRERIFTTTVKQNIKVAESQKDGIPVIYFDAACHASKAYLALCEEVLEMETGCPASICAARISVREQQAGQTHPTFTPDVMGPKIQSAAVTVPTIGANDCVSGDSQVEAHAGPISALMTSGGSVESAVDIQNSEPELVSAQPNAIDIMDESFRPRLSLKPGSCKIPLPPP